MLSEYTIEVESQSQKGKIFDINYLQRKSISYHLTENNLIQRIFITWIIRLYFDYTDILQVFRFPRPITCPKIYNFFEHKVNLINRIT